MSLKNIKVNTQAQRGFTIVELLIVVVVIAILAAITIVSYNGITTRANASAAAAAAATVQKKVELYASDGPTGLYPATLANLTSASPSTTYYLSGIDPTSSLTTNPTASNGTKTVKFVTCGIATADSGPTTVANITGITGNVISYFDYAAGTGVKTVSTGQTSGTVSGTTKTILCPTA